MSVARCNSNSSKMEVVHLRSGLSSTRGATCASLSVYTYDHMEGPYDQPMEKKNI